MLPFSASLACVATLDLTHAPVTGRLAGWFSHADACGLVSDGGPQGRYSYLMAEADAAIDLAHDDPAAVADILHAATAFVSPEAQQDGLSPFTGGLIGMAAFELGERLEAMPRRPFRMDGRDAWPELVLRRYPAVLAFDHHAQTLTAIGRGATQAQASAARDRLIALYDATPVTPAPDGPLLEAPLRSETPDAVHEDKVATLVRQIHAGDLFQANIARGWNGRLRAGVTPGDIMAALNRAGPAPFGGFLRFDQGTYVRAIVSNSPERFIRLDGDGVLQTQPIKGTRPRGKTPAEDAALATELLASAKDQAENLMIVDLMRHDLAKVARVGSVTVPKLNALESYANVHHLVSTVVARVADGRTAADVLLATLPAGSISGAPKVQAMKVIHAMEPARGPYCGSLFFIDACGAMDSNVLIRTLVFERDGALEQAAGRWDLRVCAGGGIVADSDPVAERMETETKLSLIRRVLEA